jgi:hypothetical protein
MRTMGRSGIAHRRDEKAVVVLVNCAGGRELEIVADVLAHCLATPTVLIRQADLGSASMALDVGTGVLEIDGRRVRPAVVWIRHASASAMTAHARPAGSLRTLEAESWAGFLEHVAATADAALPGGSVIGTRQLADAARLGVAVPRTVLATDVVSGVRDLRSPTVIVKSPDFRLYEADRSTWPGHVPSVVDRDAVMEGAVKVDRDGASHPVVVQEYVAHSRELRVYHLDGGICAFEVGKPDPASLWTDPDSVTVSPVVCPAAVAKTVRTLCSAWGLRYGAFDILVPESGEPVFLEANPDGDWLWFESKARWHGVTFMAAVMVRELFVRSTR